jgi:hypothetical protein
MLKTKLLELAASLESERRHFRDGSRLWADTVVEPLPADTQSRLEQGLDRCVELRAQRVQEIRDLAENAEPAIAARLFDAAVHLDHGDDVTSELNEIAVIAEKAIADGEKTRLLTLGQLARVFGIDARLVERDVLSRYWNEKVGRKYRLRVVDMPPNYEEALARKRKK